MEDRFETFTLLISRINRNIRKIKNQEMAEYDLRGSHVSCLYYLYPNGGLTATDLCERCEEDKASISRTLDLLEAQGYITCPSKTGKRYKSPIELTDKGREIAKIINHRIEQVLDHVSLELTEEERASFYRSLSTISNSLDVLAKSGREGTV